MTKLGWQKLHICPKVTKMGSITGHRIDYNGGRGSERPAAHTQQKLTRVLPGATKLKINDHTVPFKMIQNIMKMYRRLKQNTNVIH